MLGRELQLAGGNGKRFEINQLLFADDTALAAHLRKWCGLKRDFCWVSQKS